MNPHDDTLLQDLSAWMDGELPPDQARFLERRLAADPELRARWERWQFASACLRGQVALPSPGLPGAVAAALAGETPVVRRRWPWVAGLAAAVLAAALLPGLTGSGDSPGLPSPAPGLAGPDRPAPVLPVPGSGPVSPAPVAGEVLAVDPAPVARPWPRSPLAPDDRAMEAYLVRHNAMAAGDGLGGFMPYVDVVAHEQAVPAAEADAD